MESQVAPPTMRVCVRDTEGVPIVGAQVSVEGAPAANVVTGPDGCLQMLASTASLSSVNVTVAATSFASQTVRAAGKGVITVTLLPAAASEQIQVTANRTPLSLEASASSVRVLTGRQLAETPGFFLDDRLRSVAGFQLFRRTGSWVANPTTQGTSLRGLGSTAASRTLVLSDQVPLNDAFGGWVHWNEIPQLAVRNVSLLRGGGSDLYGSSAIGGVIDVLPVQPRTWGYAADLSGGTQTTTSLNALLTGAARGWSGLAATTLFRSAGYILTAPVFRGSVDLPANVHSQSGHLELRRATGEAGSVFLRGNLLNEARGNGTRMQTNGTRIWRYDTGGDWTYGSAGRVLLRGYGNNQGYRQTFSTINATRSTEALNRRQKVPSQQVGGALQWAQGIHAVTLVAGFDLLDTRGKNDETPVTAGVAQPTISIPGRQRQIGGYGEILWQPNGSGPLLGGWSAALSGRVDRFRSFDAIRHVGSAITALPETDETVFNPRLGLVKRVSGAVSLSGSVYRAFRGPTMNELYRTSQVGQQVTQANPNLRSERATGFELSGLVNLLRRGSVRGSYFWTEVNRPVAAVTLSSTPTSQVLMRQNLGQLRSRGLTVEWQARPVRHLEMTGGYQYAVSTVTRFEVNPNLVGRWTPQVPRNTFTAQGRWSARRLGVLSLDLRASGRQYDDAENTSELHSYFQLNAFAEHSFGEHISVYAAAQNLLDRSIEAGRTPLLTLGAPRSVLAGIRLH